MGNRKVAKSISEDLQARESDAQKAEDRTRILQRFLFQNWFSCKYRWQGSLSPRHFFCPRIMIVNAGTLPLSTWQAVPKWEHSKMGLTFLELVTWRKATCGRRKWTEHYLVLEGKQLSEIEFEGDQWQDVSLEKPLYTHKVYQMKSFSPGGVFFSSPRSPNFIKFWPSMPSGCQKRQKIFESTSLSKAPKSPGLNLLSCAMTLAQSIFHSRKCHLTCWLNY